MQKFEGGTRILTEKRIIPSSIAQQLRREMATNPTATTVPVWSEK
jgi:hypothetical protein